MFISNVVQSLMFIKYLIFKLYIKLSWNAFISNVVYSLMKTI